MKPLKKAILFSVSWVFLVIGAGIMHTNVFLAGQLTPQQDEAISGRYGFACGIGLVLIWVIFYMRKQANR